MNTCDPCVWNVKEIEKQLTLLFHVDNLLLARVQPQAITNHVNLLDNLCGEKDLLTVTRGKMNECLGMTLDFCTKGSVAYSQHDAIKKFWLSLLEDL